MEESWNTEFGSKLRTLVDHAWDREVHWSQIKAWVGNFRGKAFDEDQERLHGVFALSHFMYFSKRLLREMLRSLYRDQFEAPLIQRIRRNHANTRDVDLIRSVYETELNGTRFLGVGNPAESGAHLLYYFRQVNYLPKNLFADFAAAFSPTTDDSKTIRLNRRNDTVSRYVFFDDLVGTGDQVTRYLKENLARIRAANPDLDLRFMSLFAMTKGLQKMNHKDMFDGKATCLFELDDSYKAFDDAARYFSNPPTWFDAEKMKALAQTYGETLQPDGPLGYGDGQLLLGFAHNTPNHTLPIFSDEGGRAPWCPMFARYDKKYRGRP